jgi:hypothetical protein
VKRRWDPFVVLWLDHHLEVSDRVVRAARRARLREVWRWHRDPFERAVAARRVNVAYWALRTAGLRRRVLTDMAVQTGAWDWFYMRPEVRALANAALPPMFAGDGPGYDPGLPPQEVWDRRALVRETAALRLERAEQGVQPWPRTWAGRLVQRVRYGRPLAWR